MTDSDIGYGKVASGRAPVGAAARGGMGCGAGGGGAVLPRVFHDEGLSSSSSPLSSSLAFEPSAAAAGGGGALGSALDAAGDTAKDAASKTADDAAAAARHLEANRRTLGWQTDRGRRAESLSGAERLYGGASLLQEEEVEEVSSDEGQQASLQSLGPEERELVPGTW